MDYEKLFKEFEKEFLDLKKNDYYYPEARALISDIKYFNAHISRTRTSKRFSFEIILGYNGLIMNWFVKELFFNYDWLEEEKMIQRLKIYDITSAIFHKMQWTKNGKWRQVGTGKYIEKAIKWAHVLYYYTNIKLRNYIGSFCGSSYTINGIEKIWDQLESKEKAE